MITATATLAAMAVLSTSTRLDPEPVLLDEYAPCGQTSLYLVCRLRSLSVTLREIQELVGPADRDGHHSFADLSRAAKVVGLQPAAIHVDRERLMALPTPAIVHMQYPNGIDRHLTVLLATSQEGAWILDSPYPPSLVPWSIFENFWTRNVLVFPVNEDDSAAIESLLHSSVSQWLWLSNLALSIASVVGLIGWTILSWHQDRRTRRGTMAPGTSQHTYTQRVVPTLCNCATFISIRKRHYSYIGAAGLALLVSAILGGFAVSKGIELIANEPYLVIDKPLIDLGEFAPGEHEATVTLHNKGRRNLEISKVESSCSCAVVAQPGAIAPNSSAQLKVTLFVKPGRGFANLAVRSNDSRGLDDLTLQWHGSAQPALLPRRIDADDVALGSTYERIVRVVYPGGRSAIVPILRRVECNSDKVKVVPLNNDPVAFRTASDLSASQAVGYFDLGLSVDSPDKPDTITANSLITLQYGEHEYTLTLPVTIRFRDVVTAEPNAALFSASGSKEFENETRSIRLRGSGSIEHLEIVKCPHWLHCDLLQRDDGERELRMVATNAPTERVVRDTIELRWAADSHLQISIAVTAVVHSVLPPEPPN